MDICMICEDSIIFCVSIIVLKKALNSSSKNDQLLRFTEVCFPFFSINVFSKYVVVFFNPFFVQIWSKSGVPVGADYRAIIKIVFPTVSGNKKCRREI